jgi:ATP-dependent 26S proteasome regulatory subunit
MKRLRRNRGSSVTIQAAPEPAEWPLQGQGETHLDFGYLEEGMRKWESNASTILAFETEDPMRSKQIKAFLVVRFPQAEIYTFNRWDGLRVWDKERGDFVVVTRGAAGSYDAIVMSAIEQSISSLPEALKYLDPRLKGGQTILILEDLDPFREDLKDQPLIDALRAWAHHPAIISNRSLIVLIVGSLGQVVDELTADRVALERPPLATEAERAHIISETSRSLEVTLTDQEREILVRNTTGLNLHQLGCVLREAWQLNGYQGFSLEQIKRLKSELIERSNLLELEEPQQGFESVGGYEPVKRLIYGRLIRVLREPGRAAHFGVDLPRGILLFGPPGTGKTIFARALAKELSLPFINFKTENLYHQYLGMSGRLFDAAIRLAEQMAPCILFIDEIDRFGKRGQAQDSASEETRKVFNQILSWLGSKERKSILVGTTNTPEQLDPALIRPGRFDCLVPFLYPGKAARRQILEIHLGLTGASPRPPALAISEAELEQLLEMLAEQTEGMSGAELEELVKRAKSRGFNSEREELLPEDFLQILEGFRINKESRAKQKERYLEWWASQPDVPIDYELLEALRVEQ